VDTLNNVIVKKPWGYEYLCYRNECLAIWFLNIDSQRQTSMHCHPKKNTGFIVLKGTVQLSFLNNTVTLNELDKIHIFKTRFHASKAVSDGPAIVLEIESPEDKFDLVRLSDASGRQNSNYESTEHFSPKNGSEVWIPEASNNEEEIKVFDKKIGHLKADKDWVSDNVTGNIKLVITQGSLRSGEENKILNPGDVIDIQTLLKLCNHFEFEKNTSYIYVTE
jgi:hypothetical protein